MKVIKRDGRVEPIKLDKITKRIAAQSKGLSNVEPFTIAQKVIQGIYDGVKTSELDELAIKTAANMATTHPDYDTLAARLSASVLHKETKTRFTEVMEDLYNRVDSFGNKRPGVSEDFIKVVRKHQRTLDAEIIYKRDYEIDYLGLQTLKRSYLQKLDGKIVERPQHMFMRVALGIHGKDIEKAIDTYDKLSRKLFTHATPTLFNAGTNKPQLASCFLLHMDDDSIDGIYKTLTDCAKISQLAGGIGLHIHNIRASGSPIYGTGGTSNGIVPMARVFDATMSYIDQGGGKRKGSCALYLAPWHADVFEWLDLKKNTGKDEVRARNLFYGLWTPDLFMERVEADADWSLFDPNTAPGLADVWGDDFRALYLKYEEEGRAFRVVKARELWKKVLDLQIETSMPYIMYSDACNRKSNQQNLGTIKSSNLCTEIVEYTSPEEIAVCNLASICLPQYIEGRTQFRYNHKKLHEIVKTAVVNLNRVIDINYYPLPETKNSNLAHRPIGIGVQGLADVFIRMRLGWDSFEAFKLNREIFETIYHAAVEASVEEAARFGPYPSYEGSPASQGKLQYDMWFDERQGREVTEYEKALLKRGGQTAEDFYCASGRYDWAALKEKMAKHGLRNSLLMAPMPTASTANIMGNTEGIEPIPSNIYKRNVLSGEFVRVNKYLVKDLQELGLWDEEMKQRIIAAEGSIQPIEGIPDEIKNLYRTVWEVKQRYIIDLSADRGAFICQSQSLNIYMPNPTFSKLTSMHFYGWKKGLKTGSYYIRQQAARQAQKFTVDVSIEKNLKATAAVDERQQAMRILLEAGWEEEDLAEYNLEDLQTLARGACSTNNPEDCEMCGS